MKKLLALNRGEILQATGRYDDAIAFGLDAIRRFEDFAFMRMSLVGAYLGKEKMTEACRVVDEMVALHAEQTPYASLEIESFAGICYVLSGRTKDAEELFEALRTRFQQQDKEPPSGFGFMLSALGRQDEAYPLIERSYRARNFQLLLFNLMHVFERYPFPLDDRIKRVLARMKLGASPW